MKIRAEQKNTRQSARKVRLLANQVKDMSLEKAFEQLALMERRASIVLLKVIRQAVANAIHNHQLSFEDLELDNIIVKVGPTYKRWQPVSRGRAHKILKRTCHIEVTLKTKQDQEQVADNAEIEEKDIKQQTKKSTVKKSATKEKETVKETKNKAKKKTVATKKKPSTSSKTKKSSAATKKTRSVKAKKTAKTKK